MDQRRYPRRAWIKAVASVAAMLALAACGPAAGVAQAPAAPTDTTDATVAPSANASTPIPTTSPTAAATTAGVPTATPAPASPTPPGPLPTATGVPASASSPAATPTARSSGVKLTILSSGTQASYQVQEQLAGRSLPSQAIGRTSAVSGVLVLDAQGSIVPGQSKIEVDVRTLKSDESMRDNYIQRTPLQTSIYPTATFVPSKVAGLPWPLPSSGTAKFTMDGDLTVHGTTKPVSWTVSATFAGGQVTGNATMPFTFSEFGMTAPHTPIALSVQDSGTLALQFTAARATA